MSADVELVSKNQGCLYGDYKVESTDVAFNVTTGGSLSMEKTIDEPGLYSLLYSR